MKRALLIHDIYNSHNQGWYDTIRHNLEFLGFQVIAPIFTFPEDCNYDSWSRIIERELKQAGVEPSKTHVFDIVVAHGVGAYFAIGALSRAFIASRSNYFIAPYLPHKQNNKSYEDIGLKFDASFLKTLDKSIFTEMNTSVFYSNDDVYISLQAYQKLQQALEASWYFVKDGKHFTVGDTVDIPELRSLLDEQVKESQLTKEEKLSKVINEFETFEGSLLDINKIEVGKNGIISLPKKYRTPKNSFYTLKSDVNNVLDTESSIELSNYMKKENRRANFHKKQTVYFIEKILLVILIMLLVVGIGYVSYYIYRECCKPAPAVIEKPIVAEYLYIKTPDELDQTLRTFDMSKKLFIPYVVLKNLKPDNISFTLSPLYKFIESDSGIIISKDGVNIDIRSKVLTPISANLMSRDILKILGSITGNRKFIKKIVNEKGRIIETYSYETYSETSRKIPTQSGETGDIEISDVKQGVHNYVQVLGIELESIDTVRITIPYYLFDGKKLGN